MESDLIAFKETWGILDRKTRYNCIDCEGVYADIAPIFTEYELPDEAECHICGEDLL